MNAPRAADPARAAKALSGAAAATLLLEGIAVLFVPRGIVQSDGLGWVRLTVLLALAVLLILSSGIQRRPRGLLIGTVLQVPLVLTGLYSNAMWFVGGVFLLVWLYLLQIRKDLVGSPFGPVPDPPAPTAEGPQRSR